MATRPKGIGGSFAPPLSDDLLKSYRTLIDTVPEKTRLREALDALHSCSSKWWELPESTGGKTRPHPVGLGTIVSLDEEIAAELWEHIPWSEELEGYKRLFETEALTAATPETTPLRDAAYHLLWHVIELDHDQEPLTSDKL